MNRIKAIIAGGPPAVLAAGGTLIYAQHELHYLLRPSVIETLAGLAGLAGAIALSKRNASKKAAQEAKPEGETTSTNNMVVWDLPTALPKAQPAQRPEWLKVQQQEAQLQRRK